MTVILADKRFTEYYNIDDDRRGLVATIPWAMTGECASNFASREPLGWISYF